MARYTRPDEMVVQENPLSATTMPAVYETFESLFNRRSSEDELIDAIRRFERNSLLWVCAEIVARIQLWARPALHNRNNYLSYLRDLFDPETSTELFRRSTSEYPVRLVFHRRQIGLIAKLAVRYADGDLDARLCRSELGTFFLMANDRFHYGLLPNPEDSTLGERDAALRMVTEMLAVYEGGAPDISAFFTRGHLMLTRYAPALAKAADYVDVAGVFQQKTGFSIPEFEALIFSVHARFGALFSQTVVLYPELLPLRTKDFETTTVTAEKTAVFLEFVSIPQESLKGEIVASGNGANDATPFRKHPMVENRDPATASREAQGHLMIDNMAFLERATSGPYWTANADHSKDLHTFWGAVFEGYVTDLLSRACAGTNAQFFPDPRQDGDASVQICDGIVVAGSTAVLIECKANMFRADSKYKGDPALLLKEIEKKWVRNEKGKKKGVDQLSAAVRLLFDNGKPQAIFNKVDWTKIKSVHLSLVTLDSLGETIGMSKLLNTFLPETLDVARYGVGFIKPLHCMDIASLERAAAYFDTLALPEILQRWLDESSDLTAPLSMIDLGSPRQNKWIQEEWEGVARQIVPILYPTVDMNLFLARAKESFQRMAG